MFKGCNPNRVCPLDDYTACLGTEFAGLHHTKCRHIVDKEERMAREGSRYIP